MLIVAFIFSFAAWILQGILLPKINILAFFPFISLFVMKSNLAKSLWVSALIGSLLDLFSDDPMGLHALNYVLATMFLWKIRKAFDPENSLHLSLLTLIGSSLSTGLQMILLFLFDRRIPFNGKWILTDLIGMPVIDAVYAFVWIAAPISLFKYLSRIWMVFWLKKHNPSPTSH